MRAGTGTMFPSAFRPAVLTLASAVLLTLAIASFCSSAQAADFTVNSTADSSDPGTLRTAINDAATSTDANDRIVFAAGLSGTINLASNLPALQGPLKIVGPGSDKLAIDGGDAHSIFVAIDDTSISGLALSNGSAPAGGGAVVFLGGTSTLDAVRIESNQAQTGGGVVMQNGSFTIKDSELIDNKALNGGGGFAVDSASVEFINTTISDNQANMGAGGTISGAEQNSAVFTNSRFSNNTSAQAGGGLAIFTPTVEDFVSTKVQITGSTFTGNKSTSGIGESGLGGGAIFSGSSDTDIDSSLFEGNSSATIGGAVYLNAPLPASRASIQNSTFTANSAELAGGGIASFTFGLKIDSSTLTGNQTTTPYTPQFRGAGLSATLPAELKNSIVSGNMPEDVSSSAASEEAKGTIKGSFNLIGKMTEAMYTESVAGSDVTAGNPKLGPLADNGGPTETMLPAADSPVVNKGLSSLDTDQRGLLRPVRFGSIPFSKAKQANGSDIGAVELQSNRFTFGKVKLQKKSGIAILPVTLPSGGKISLRGSKTVKPQAKTTKKPATLKFTIRARGNALKKLKKAGTVKVKLNFTFSPKGGIASTKAKTIRLAMKKKRR